MAVDFTKQMKRNFTILAPDIFPTHMELLQEVFALHGYHVEVLHDEGPAVIAAGLKYLHNDMCYPATCAVGQQLYALTSGKYDPHRVALIQFQTGGGCRASNYIFLLRKALHNMGMDYVPVISLSFGGYEHYSGFKITPLMLFTGLRSLIYGDTLMLLKNQCLPYETNPGDTRKVIQKSKMDCRAYRSVPPQAGSHTQSDAEKPPRDGKGLPRDPAHAERLHKSRHRRRDLRQIFLVRQQRLRAVPALTGLRVHGPGRFGVLPVLLCKHRNGPQILRRQQAQAPHRSQGGANCRRVGRLAH